MGLAPDCPRAIPVKKCLEKLLMQPYVTPAGLSNDHRRCQAASGRC